MKKLSAVAAAAVLCISSAAQAGVCSLTVVDSTCSFATDTSGGQVLFRNPSNIFNLGSGGIAPFLTTQENGTESGVSTDSPIVSTLPLNDKRDNVNTFTNTFTRDNLGTVNLGGTAYFQFLLDINEPNGGGQSLLSLDTVRIWDAQSVLAQLLTSANVPTLASVDGLFSALLYAMGPGNSVLLDFDLFQGSGKGWDMEMLVPISLFAGMNPTSRIIFGTAFGGLDGASAGDGFEEWAYKIGAVPPPPPPPLPEPGTLALAGLSLLGLGFVSRKKK